MKLNEILTSIKSEVVELMEYVDDLEKVFIGQESFKSIFGPTHMALVEKVYFKMCDVYSNLGTIKLLPAAERQEIESTKGGLMLFYLPVIKKTKSFIHLMKLRQEAFNSEARIKLKALKSALDSLLNKVIIPTLSR